MLFFGPRVSTHTFGVNAYFFPTITNSPLPGTNHVIGNANNNMYYDRQGYCCPENLTITIPKL